MIQEIDLYSKILNKNHNQIIKEALEEYFYNQQQKLLTKDIADENAMTNLDFDEFWDDVDIT